MIHWQEGEKLGLKFSPDSYEITCMEKQVLRILVYSDASRTFMCTMLQVAKRKFEMQRRFKWLIRVNDKSVFSAPMKESKQAILAGERPIILTFTTAEQYAKLVPAGVHSRVAL